MSMTDAHVEELRLARRLLEHPSLAARISDVIGTPVDKAVQLLPETWSDTIMRATEKALQVGLAAAISTIEERTLAPPSNRMHKLLATAAGAGGGFFGLGALPIELPLSTTIMLRSIADTARSQGENLALGESRLACLEVFALGGSSAGDDAAEVGYFAVRAVLAREVAQAARFVAQKGIRDEAAPALVRFIAQVAARFSIPVTEKAAAQAIPALGAAGGALINLLFIDHYQKIARGHFTVRRLERTYSADVVRKVYDSL